MLTCRDVVDGLIRFVEEDPDRLHRARVRSHLDGCFACSSYLATYRDVPRIARAAYADEPRRSVLPERLVRSIAQRVRESRAELWNLLAAVAASPLLFFYFGGR